jgi:hypothetical protein
MNAIQLVTAACDMEEFIRFWSPLYSYQPKSTITTETYSRLVQEPMFTSEQLLHLFEWKNGMSLSPGKRKYVDQHIIANLDFINDLKRYPPPEEEWKDVIRKFRREGSGQTFIWDLFLLHLISPNTHPIFDQHTFRAYSVLQLGLIQEINDYILAKKQSGNSKDFMLDFYFQKYVPFYNRNRLPGTEPKQLDNALFAFGQFLKSPWGKIVLPQLIGGN